MYTLTLGELQFPVAPESLSVKRKSRNRTVDLLDGGQAVITRAPALREYTAKLLLPREQYCFAIYPGGFMPPEYYSAKLSAYAEAESEVLLTIARETAQEQAVVLVEDAIFSEDARAGNDVWLTLTLREVATSARYGVYATPGTHTIRAGDTLRILAKRYLGDAEKWSVLYGYNIEVLEAAAKQNGYADSRFGERLFAGTVLQIPQEVA